MSKHQDPRRDNPEHLLQSQQSQEGRQSNNPYASQQNAHYAPQGQQQADHRPPPDRQQQGGYPDKRGQQGSYGTAPENQYGNSPTNPYARNPGGSQGMREPWRDEPYGGDPRYEATFGHAGYGGYGVDNGGQSSGENFNRRYSGDESQYSGGAYRGYREQGGYPAEQYPQAWGQNPGSQRNRGQEGWEEEHHHSSRFDPHYLQWRSEQVRQLDEDYRAWRTENYDRFSNEFSEWRKNRLSQQGKSAENDDARKTGKDVQSPGTSGNK